MSTTSQLIEFAKSSGAFWMKRGTGIALTWDGGIYWHNLWTEHDDQGTLLYKYGPSERWEDRSTFVASPFEDWTAKGAIIHVGEFARSYLDGIRSSFRRLILIPLLILTSMCNSSRGLEGLSWVEKSCL